VSSREGSPILETGAVAAVLSAQGRMLDKKLDPERGKAVAEQPKSLRVQGILITAAQQGYITELACQMQHCLCPDELGGKSYFEPVPDDLPDWMPTYEHSPTPKSQGGHKSFDNALLAHRLCNRVDSSKSMGGPYAKDLAPAEAARLKGIERRSSGRSSSA
jgi:hypothetical protein